ncbi:MAG: DUF1292 domain-containing protein [Clostridiales bacterium]|jgi:uncharacterized protein YrzB (UPF0473 family)|nr:DUF1292 domain-containing protein [Clostridiales bacterium]
MSEEYGNDLVTITDDEGNEYVLEHLHTLEYKDTFYMAFLPTDLDEDDEDYGLIILKVIEENGEEILGSVDEQDELEQVYELFAEVLFDDESEENVPQ